MAYEARAAAVLEWLKAVADKMAEKETEDAACPSCTELDINHNWRSCLKRMKCWKNKDGHWETEPPRDAQEGPVGYYGNPCKNCVKVVLDHPREGCPAQNSIILEPDLLWPGEKT